jgi:hypothetical protein
MNPQKIIIPVSILLSLSLFSCGTSTGSRYPQETKQLQDKSGNINVDSVNSSRNVTNSKNGGYRIVKEDSTSNDSSSTNAGYSGNSEGISTDTNNSALKTAKGYRALITTTDNLDEANKKRSEISLSIGNAAVYVVFDPPFYKVEAGDFTNINDAKKLDAKLKQLGYNDVRVVNETINIFKK